MKERELTGNEMFKMVQEECERILGKVKGKWKKRQKGVLFFINRDRIVGWYEDGDEKKDGKYVGEIENRKPNGQGTLTWFNGDKYVGEFMDGKKNGQGTYTFYYGRKYVGEFMDGKRWKGTMYYKDGKIKNIYVNGKRTEP